MISYLPGPRVRRVALAAFLLAGCASNPPMDAPAPATSPPVAAAAGVPGVDPTADLQRAAATAELTGLELGTMWTFENPPLDYWGETYDFRPDAEWLEHVRLASVRYGQHCSASFVSPDGLVVTNHHCARDCVDAVSTETTDYVVAGFYADERSEERVCPGLYLDQLVAIEDVTAQVRAAGAGAQEAEQERIEQECTRTSGAPCEVVSLFHGGQFKLYRYKRFSPVKLVFAPELQAGFFGGDPDNFTYPRYALDAAFVRAYEADSTTAARTPHYFPFDPEGASEGEVLFVTGNPGSTSRQITVSQLMYERNYRHPFVVALLNAQRDFLVDMAEASPDRARAIREQLFSVENSLKAYTGQLGGLRDTLLVGRKIKWEQEFRHRVDADPALRAQYGDVWNRIAELQRQKLRLGPVRDLADTEFYGFAAPQLTLAGMLVDYIRALALPEAERSPDLRGEQLERSLGILSGQTMLDPELGRLLLANQLELAQEFLPAGHPVLRAALRAGETPEAAAERIIAATRIGDVAFRQELIRGGVPALDASTDPVIAIAREIDAARTGLDARWAEIDAAQAVEQERLASALFAVYGTLLPPDATFTLRISDGVMKGYPYNGTVAPPFTTFYGMWGRSASFHNEDPFTLPRTYAAREEAIDMKTPLDFVTTNDITGGNSGSPIIDREARIVGLAFDGNIESLPNEFLFRPDSPGRTVGVHSAAIIAAIRDIYRARPLLDEILAAAGAGR